MHKNILTWMLFCCLMLAGNITFAQETTRQITGIVTDNAGSILAGVTVSIKGTKTVVTTNNNGKFSITVPIGKKWLSFTSVGFDDYEVDVSNANDISVKLQSNVGVLSDVVVVGYGNQKKRTVTSAISRVENIKPEQNMTGNVMNTLQGKVAGLTVMNTNATPGSSPYFSIRGLQVATNAAQAGEYSTPLIVVDGLILETGVLNTDAASLKLSNINPQDIESVEVLKDAASAAIYGARGSQGVILITTKKGKLNSRPNVNLNMYSGMTKSAVNFRPMTVDQYKNIFVTARQNRINDINNPTAPETVALQTQINDLTNSTKPNSIYYKGKYDANWVDEFLPDNAKTSNVQASMSGGNDRSTYYFSTGLLKQDNANGFGKYTRQSFRLSLTQQVNDWLKINGDISLSHSMTKGMTDLFANGIQMRPDMPTVVAKYPDPLFFTYGSQFNPIVYLDYYKSIKNENWNYLANVGADLKLYKGLTFHSGISGAKNDTRNSSYAPAPLFSATGSALSGYGYGYSYTWNNLLNYNFQWKKLDATAMIGYELYENKTNTENINYTGFPTYESLTGFLGNASAYGAYSRFNFSLNHQTSESYFGRANLSWDRKYLLNLSIRRDASSLLGPENRNATFPAISGGWIVSDESFMKSLKFLNMLKLRASWGKTGSLRTLAPWSFDNLLSTGSYMGQSAVVVGPTQANPDIQWEKTNQTDLGLDLSVLQNRISFSFDYYNRNTAGFISTIPVSASGGIGGGSTQYANLGSLKNKGMDFELAVRSAAIAKVKWSVSAVGNINKNRMVKLAKDPTVLAGIAGVGLSYALEGHPIGSVKLFQSNGIDPLTGDIKYIDLDKDGVITTNDQIWYDLGQPKFGGGMNFNVEYAGISLSGSFNGSLGRKIYDYNNVYYRQSSSFALSGGIMINRPEWILDGMWQKPGDNAKLPRAIYGVAGDATAASSLRSIWNTLPSDFYLVNGDFLKLQNLTLAYQLPQSLVKKASINSARIYIAGQNLLIFKNKNNTALDPEILSYGMMNSLTTSPISRIYTIGLDINF